MKSIDQWLDEYGESHKNKTNKMIHWVCIPLIIFSLVGLLWIIPTPEIFEGSVYLNWASIVLAAALLFYLRLSIPLFIGFVFLSAVMLLGNATLYQILNENWLYQLAVSIGIFVLAWIGQFIGHNIEGKKPSFFKDLQFLLIGPAWLMHFALKSVGLPYKNG